MQTPRATIRQRLKAAGIAENIGHATWLDDGIAAVIEKLSALGKLDTRNFPARSGMEPHLYP